MRKRHVRANRQTSTTMSGKSFTVEDPQRLSGPPPSLVEALRQLGDEESAERLVAVYVKRGEPKRQP